VKHLEEMNHHQIVHARMDIMMFNQEFVYVSFHSYFRMSILMYYMLIRSIF